MPDRKEGVSGMTDKKRPEKTRRLATVRVVQPDKIAQLRARLLTEAQAAVDYVAQKYAQNPELAELIERLKQAVKDVK
jgi:hypothetical protein